MFKYQISNNDLHGFYTDEFGLDFQADVKLSDYPSEEEAAAAAEDLAILTYKDFRGVE